MRRLALLLLGLALLTSGCVSLADPQAAQVHNQGVIAQLDQPETIFTQTFTTPRSGLNSLTFWASLASGDYAQGRLLVTVSADPDTAPFYSGIFPASAIQENTPLRISFPRRDGPAGQTYTLTLRAEGAPFGVQGRNEDIYADGQAALNQVPLNADLAFKTTYVYTLPAALADLAQLWDWRGLALPLFIVLILPGWLLLELTDLHRRFDLWENTALAVGLSLSLLPLVMLWTTLLRLPWRGPGLWSAAFLAAALLAGLILVRHFRQHRPLTLCLPSHTDLAMLIVFLLSCGVRVVMVRDMAAPAWVDSVHHALLGRLVAEEGGFPASFEPYFKLDPTRYHPGFHSAYAALLLLTQPISGEQVFGGVDSTVEASAQLLLVYGQALNVLAVLAAYLFTTALTGDKRAGVVAALAAGLFTPMPAYYTSWGRYTQLAGMVILPVPVALWQRWLKTTGSTRPDPCYPLLAGLASGGLFLVHYRVAAFLGLFLLLDGIILLAIGIIRAAFLKLRFKNTTPSPPKGNEREFRKIVLFAFLTAGTAVLLTAPWLFPTLVRTILPVASQPSATAAFMGDFPWSSLTAALGKIPLGLAGAGILLALLQRRRITLLLPGWIMLLLLLANLNVFGLPGGNLVNNTTVAISLYLPIAALAGYLVSQAIEALCHFTPPRWHASGSWLLVLLALGVGLWGAHHLVTVLNPNTYLVRPADLRGIAWVKDNIPPEATVLVNPFLWGYGIYAGGDGGYWISALAGQPTLPPPVLHAMDYSEAAKANNRLSGQIIALADRPEDLATLLHGEGIQYIFLGARGGALSPSVLLQSGHFEALYHQEGVWVFEIKNSP